MRLQGGANAAVIHVGVDLAETQPHQVCIMDDDRIVAEFRVPKEASGLSYLLKDIARRESDKTKVVIAVERPDGPFVGGLLEAGYTVYPINPKAIERYRERFALGGTKTDLVDARCLAGLLRTDREAYRPIKPDSPLTRELRMVTRDPARQAAAPSTPPPLTRELRMVTRDLSEIEKTQTMIVLQLRAALYASFPAAVECFGDLTAPSTLGFLKTFPTLEAVRAASDEEIAKALKDHGYGSPRKKVERIREVLAQEQFKVDPAVVQAKRLLITTLAETLLTLHQQIRGYEKRLKQLFKDHPDREIFLSLRGAGLRIAARMAAEFGDDRQRFGCAGDVAAFAGMAPVTRQSGKSKVVHFRRACCKPFRELMHQFAFCSLKWNPWAWDYYTAKRKQGKKHAETLRCLASIWLRIIYAMWQNRTTYDEPTFLKASGRTQPEAAVAV